MLSQKRNYSGCREKLNASRNSVHRDPDNRPGGNTATFSKSGKVSSSEDIWTGIIGDRGHYRLGDGGWFTNFYADIGGGSSTFTWQGLAGIGYAFHWGNILLDYRYLYYDQDDGELLDDLRFGGLALGVNFQF